MTDQKYKVVPIIATNDMKREACFVELFSDISEAASDLTWEEAGEIYSAMIQMAPDTGMVAVRREDIEKLVLQYDDVAKSIFFSWEMHYGGLIGRLKNILKDQP